MGLGIILLLATFIILAFSSNLITKPKEIKRGWKIIKEKNDAILYAELDDNKNWKSISFKVEYYSKNAPRHLIYVNSDWDNFPNWASENRPKIMERLKSQLKEPEYTFTLT